MDSLKHRIKQLDLLEIIHIQTENLLAVHGIPFHSILFHSIPFHSILFPSMKPELCKISGFHHSVNESFALQGFYVVEIGGLLLTFPDNLCVLS
jgi:hypothetical protein